MRNSAAVLAVALALGGGVSAKAGDGAQTRESMGQIFEAMRVLLPLSGSSDTFRAPENRDRVRAALETLADEAEAVAVHVEGAGASAGYLARSLERDSRAALEQYERQPEGARLFVQRASEYCIGCHAQRPAREDSPLARGFLEQSAFERLSPLERAELQVATRQFDAALESYEALFRSSEVAPAELLDPLIAYLNVAIRVKNDFERPSATLREFAKRPDLWQALRRDVRSWVESLERLKKRAGGEPDLERARRLIREGQQQLPAPDERGALVHYVVASSSLQNYMEAHPEPSPQTAEAYWLLGLTECLLGRERWVSQAQFLLETAIEMAPEQEFAARAYALLEDQTILAFARSGQPRLPPETAQRLATLRRLVESRRGKL